MPSEARFDTDLHKKWLYDTIKQIREAKGLPASMSAATKYVDSIVQDIKNPTGLYQKTPDLYPWLKTHKLHGSIDEQAQNVYDVMRQLSDKVTEQRKQVPGGILDHIYSAFDWFKTKDLLK